MRDPYAIKPKAGCSYKVLSLDRPENKPAPQAMVPQTGELAMPPFLTAVFSMWWERVKGNACKDRKVTGAER